MKPDIESDVDTISPDPEITDAEIETLGIDPVPMYQYDSFEDFVYESSHGLNNSHVVWIYPDDSMVTLGYRDRPAFERFIHLRPDFTADLRGRAQGHSMFSELDLETKRDIYRVYQAMSKLVDKKDRDLFKENGEIDYRYLCK